jgi:hypothetical protein
MLISQDTVRAARRRCQLSLLAFGRPGRRQRDGGEIIGDAGAAVNQARARPGRSPPIGNRTPPKLGL